MYRMQRHIQNLPNIQDESLLCRVYLEFSIEGFPFEFFHLKFSIEEAANLIAFTEEILNEKIYFLCSVYIFRNLSNVYKDVFLRK